MADGRKRADIRVYPYGIKVRLTDGAVGRGKEIF